jgi:Flp pilus assembly protein TadG
VPRSSRGRRERGQVLVILALALVAIVAAVGLVIDGGFAFAQRRAEQNAADFAALAGANALLNGRDATAAALAAAQENGYAHGVGGTSVGVTVTSTTVKVDLTAPHANYFAGVVGQPTWQISVTATALTGVPTRFMGVAPFVLRQDAFDPISGLPYLTYTVPYDFTKTQGQNSDYPQLVFNMAWTNLGTGNVSSNDVKDALDGTAPINTDLILNQYIGQQNNGVHNSLFDTNGNQPSVNTTLAGHDVAVPIVGPPITGQAYCFNAGGTSDGTNTDGCFRGWALFHVVSAAKGGGTADGTITGYFFTGITRSASAESVCAVTDTSCAGFFKGVYVIKLIN